MLQKVANWSFVHRRRVLIGWLLAAVALTVAGAALARDYADGGRLEGTDSDEAYQLLAREFPAAGGETATVVFQVPGGVDQPRVRAAIDRYLADAAGLPNVAGVASPYDDPGQVSADRTIAYADVNVATDTDYGDFQATADQLRSRAGPVTDLGVRTEFAGGWFTMGGVPSTEALGLVAAVVILLLSFGSVVAMGLPILTALVGVAVAMAGVSLWTILVPTPEFTPQVATMIGLGVGIDYALFIITRYRAELARRSPQDALAATIGTAGRSVVFAGCTVVISLLGILLCGLEFLRGLAFGTAGAVLVAVAAAVTLLPALLSFATGRLQRSALRHERRLIRRGHHEGLWHRWGRLVRRRPRSVAVGGLVALLLMSAPVLGIRLAGADAGNDEDGTTTRAAYDLLAEGFGPGANGPLLVAVEGGDDAAVGRLRQTTSELSGVASVSTPVVSPSGEATLMTVVPTSSPQSQATETLVGQLRDHVIPASGLEAHVGGATASNVDFARLMAARLPIFIGAVLLVSFLLLAAVFRSILVPLKAVVMNLLSIGAANGVMVAVFQWGWFGDLLGVGGAPIEPWAPMLLFAIVFGLSMDYEVFLLSAVREHYDRTGDNSSAVVEGLSSTARVITAAAAIMVFVFGGFVFGDLRQVKLIGFGLATAVLLDATIVRMVLVPATMELLGARNWWLPRWIDRLLPRLRVDQAPFPGRAPAAAVLVVADSTPQDRVEV